LTAIELKQGLLDSVDHPVLDWVWDGKQIIPSAWIDRARAGNVSATFGYYYANLWWSLPEKGACMARGRHSQLILVLPKLDIVAVMTGILRDDEFYPVPRLIDDISRAVKADHRCLRTPSRKPCLPQRYVRPRPKSHRRSALHPIWRRKFRASRSSSRITSFT
jgi:CubicO group peptidase (beta-lactamase class C family)